MSVFRREKHEAQALIKDLKNDKILFTKRIMNLEQREPDINVLDDKVVKEVLKDEKMAAASFEIEEPSKVKKKQKKNRKK